MFCSHKIWGHKTTPLELPTKRFRRFEESSKELKTEHAQMMEQLNDRLFSFDVFSTRFMWWRSTMTLHSNKALLIHDSKTKTMTHQNLRSFSSFHSISRFGSPISVRELVMHQKTKVHQVWPKAVSRPKRASYHWAASKFGRGTTRGYSTGRSAVWSDVTQHLDSGREIDIESWAQSFVNILVYTFFLKKKLGLMDREMEIEIDIVSCCWEMNLLAAFNDGGY